MPKKKIVPKGRKFIWGNKKLGCAVKARGKEWDSEDWFNNTFYHSTWPTRTEAVAHCRKMKRQRGGQTKLTKEWGTWGKKGYQKGLG